VARIGYFLSSEEHTGPELVEGAVLAERAGFDRIAISDHFHPWLRAQGQSPFVWGVLGAIAQATSWVEVVTGVVCPTTRIHPVILAQATATAQQLLGGRLTFGVGSGEALNEHILGDRWPAIEVRHEMLERQWGASGARGAGARSTITAATTRSRTRACGRCRTRRRPS
jgi:G6PDH family F420-dependent oxidoreductase